MAFALGCGHIGGAGLELRLINMDERIAVGTRYFVVDPASWWAAPSPRIPTGYYPAICSDEPIEADADKPILMVLILKHC